MTDANRAGAVGEHLQQVRHRIRTAGADPEAVTIVAVTKGHDPACIRSALAAGIRDIGENYAAELATKHRATTEYREYRDDDGDDDDVPFRWHFLGHVQRNKVRQIAPFVHLWQGVDRRSAGEEVARRSPGAKVLVQVNVSGEASKNGCTYEDAPALCAELTTIGLDVRGLMAVGPSPDAASSPREAFRRLRRLADELGLPERSMGMSDDLEIAVEEGSTMVRIGRALFGPRDARTDALHLRR